MHTEPKVEHRDERHYVAIETCVPMSEIATSLPPLIPQVVSWLERHKVPADGPPFFHYLAINKDSQLQVEVGVPVKSTPHSDDRIHTGTFPAGQYVTVTHTGHFNKIRETHMAVETWLEKNGSKWKQQPVEKGKWGPRTEFYPMDPEMEPDPNKWRAEIELLLVEDEN
jgi:predicted transcriptional regulator YdeE